MRKAVEMLKAGEEELFLTQHPVPKKCMLFLFYKLQNIALSKLIYF